MIINLTKKANLSDSRVTNISNSFTHKMARKSAGIDMERHYVTVTLCISAYACRRTLVVASSDQGPDLQYILRFIERLS